MLEEKIEKTVSEYQMQEIYQHAVLGLSGGADSVALLSFLQSRTSRLLAVHINHQIRNEDAQKDEDFCKELCKKYAVELHVHRVDVPRLAKEKKQGLEETAREVRYSIFEEESKAFSCAPIVTAHNATDNAETVLLHLVRGSGLNGLCGIRPKSRSLFRPLLDCTKAEILSYCREKNLPFVTDETNDDTTYRRNYIRHEILPKLETLNPSVLESVRKLSSEICEDERYFEEQAKTFLETYGTKNGFLIEPFCSLARPIAFRVCRLFLLSYDIDISRVRFEEILSLCRLQSGKERPLDEKTVLRREQKELVLCRKRENEPYQMPLHEGINRGAIVVGYNEKLPDKAPDYIVSLNENEVKGRLIARSRREQDTVFQGKMNKKIKKLFLEHHVPNDKRERLPLICDEEGVLSLCGIVYRDGAYQKDGKIQLFIYCEDTI